MAFVYDRDGDFHLRFNDGLADLELVEDPEDVELLKGMIESHLRLTGSAPARNILESWEQSLPRFKKVMPRDYRRILLERERQAAEEQRELEGLGMGKPTGFMDSGRVPPERRSVTERKGDYREI